MWRQKQLMAQGSLDKRRRAGLCLRPGSARQLCSRPAACRWGLGPMALKKKQLVAEGKLDKHGRPNEQTPPEYLRSLPALGDAPQVWLPCSAACCISSGDQLRQRAIALMELHVCGSAWGRAVRSLLPVSLCCDLTRAPHCRQRTQSPPRRSPRQSPRRSPRQSPRRSLLR